MSRIEITSVDGFGEVTPGTDLAGLVAQAYDFLDGDVLVVTSKVVSKAEGRTRPGSRDDWLDSETTRVVATRGATSIVRNRLGLTMAAAGIDSSNVAAGTVVLLPEDPDTSARVIRERVLQSTGRNVAVVITDTAGRAWRDGQTDIAIGAAGLVVAESFAGHTDEHGNDLVVTLPAVADEIAGAAELAQGKLGGRPTALLRGRADLVLPAGSHGVGAASLVRPEGADLFGWGAREAVLRAMRGDVADLVPFGAAVEVSELCTVLSRLVEAPVTCADHPSSSGTHPLVVPAGPQGRGRDRTAITTLCFAHGWRVETWPHRDACDADVATHVSVSPFCP